MKKHYLQIFFIISHVLVSISLFYGLSIKYGFNLDIIQKISSIISSLSIIIALITYSYNKQKDRINLVIEQISFFRKEAILESDKFMEFIRTKKGKEYKFYRVRLDNPTNDRVHK
jgi:hypothetical protein